MITADTVYAEFEANRDGLEFYCHLTHFDAYDFREDCKCNVFANATCLQTHHTIGSSGVYNRTGIPPGDYTLRVIANL